MTHVPFRRPSFRALIPAWLVACDPVVPPSTADQVLQLDAGDGTLLETRIFLPDDIPSGGVPAVMIRTPYLAKPQLTAHYDADGQFYADRGYACVIQRSRAGYVYEGVAAPPDIEFRDGPHLTQWIAAQDWSNGAIGTIGGSADAYAALAAAVDNPLVKVVIAHDSPIDASYELRGGTLSMSFLYWYHFVYLDDFMSAAEMDLATNALDLASLDEAILGRDDPYWNDYLVASAPGDPHWDAESLRTRFDAICAPVLSVYAMSSAWSDPIDIWEGVRASGCEEFRGDHRLVVTPDPHAYHVMGIATTRTPVNQLMLDTLDWWLGDEEIDLSQVPAVQYRAPTDAELRGSSDWPPTGRVVSYYATSEGSDSLAGILTPSAPTADGPAFALTFDPEVTDPCDGLAGYRSAYYTLPPGPAPLRIAGSPRVTLTASATTPDTDVFATLWDADPAGLGFPTQITWGALRARWRGSDVTPAPLEPGERVALAVAMNDVAYEVPAGRSLVLEIAGARCGFAENPNTGEPASAQTRWASTTLELAHDPTAPSLLELPVE